MLRLITRINKSKFSSNAEPLQRGFKILTKNSQASGAEFKVDLKKLSKLRKETQIQVGKAREALFISNNDYDKALEWIKSQELAMGAKRAEKIKDRAVGASVITTFIDQSRGLGAIIKISCETDFVSRNETFQQLATRVCEVAAGISSKQLEKVNVEQVLESELPEEGLKVKELIQQNIGKLGENIVLKDAAGINLGIEGEESHKKAIAGYVHGASVPGGTSGKIASLLVLNVDGESKATTNNPEFTKFSKRLAQQVVGYKPLFIQEKEFQEAQSKVVTSSSGECSQIFSNPLDKQTVLLNQEYMFGGEGISTVEDALSLSGKAQNISLAIDSVAWFDSES